MSNRYDFPPEGSVKSFVSFEEVPGCFGICVSFLNGIDCAIYINGIDNIVSDAHEGNIDRFGVCLSDLVDVVDDTVIDNKLGISSKINDPSWISLEDILFNCINSETNVVSTKFTIEIRNPVTKKKIKIKKFVDKSFYKNITLERLISNLNYLSRLKRKK